MKQPDNFIINRVITQGEVSHDHDQLWYLDRLWNNQFLRLMMYYTYLLISIFMYFKRMSRDLQKPLNWPRWRDLFQKVSSSGFVAKYPVPISAMWGHVILKLTSVSYFTSLRVQLTSPPTTDREGNSRQPTVPVLWFRYQSVFCHLCKSTSVKHLFNCIMTIMTLILIRLFIIWFMKF